MKNVFVTITSMCYSSIADFDLIRSFLKANGWKIVRKIRNADLVIIYTCAFVKAKEDQAIETIKKIKKNMNKNSRLIVTGCLPTINRNRLKRIFKGINISAKYLSGLDDTINSRVKLRDISFIKPTGMSRKKFDDKRQPGYIFKEYRLRIGRGCSGKCSYCVIRRVFGKPKSRPISEILQEFKVAVRNGYTKFVLVGNEVGAYGEDIKTDIIKLLSVLAKESATVQFAISNITPDKLKEMLPRLEEFIHKKSIWRINVPVQSGSDVMLSKMKRFYTVADFKSTVEKIFKVNPEVLIETDIMVGFPSESKGDFYETVLLVEWLSKMKVFFQIFTYDPRPHTEAILMSPQVSNKEKHRRFRIIDFLCSSYSVMKNYRLFREWKKTWKIKKLQYDI